jgi:hypothetical protein
MLSRQLRLFVVFFITLLAAQCGSAAAAGSTVNVGVQTGATPISVAFTRTGTVTFEGAPHEDGFFDIDGAGEGAELVLDRDTAYTFSFRNVDAAPIRQGFVFTTKANPPFTEADFVAKSPQARMNLVGAETINWTWAPVDAPATFFYSRAEIPNGGGVVRIGGTAKTDEIKYATTKQMSPTTVKTKLDAGAVSGRIYVSIDDFYVANGGGNAIDWLLGTFTFALNNRFCSLSALSSDLSISQFTRERKCHIISPVACCTVNPTLLFNLFLSSSQTVACCC